MTEANRADVEFQPALESFRGCLASFSATIDQRLGQHPCLQPRCQLLDELKTASRAALAVATIALSVQRRRDGGTLISTWNAGVAYTIK